MRASECLRGILFIELTQPGRIFAEAPTPWVSNNHPSSSSMGDPQLPRKCVWRDIRARFAGPCTLFHRIAMHLLVRSSDPTDWGQIDAPGNSQNASPFWHVLGPRPFRPRRAPKCKGTCGSDGSRTGSRYRRFKKKPHAPLAGLAVTFLRDSAIGSEQLLTLVF